MKLWRQFWVFLAVVSVLRALSLFAQTDTDAIAFPTPTNDVVQTVGFIYGGVGWSFVPNTNLLVTWVGSGSIPLVDGWPTDDEVTFWTSPTTPIANYSGDQIATPLDWETNYVGYGQISPLRLAAGRQYYVTQGAGSNSFLAVAAYQSLGYTSPDEPMPPFQPAAELIYAGLYDGDLTNNPLEASSYQTDFLILGPTFRFQVLPGPPPLEIMPCGGALVLAWPTNAPDSVVETSPLLSAPAWEEMSSTPAVLGEMFVVTNFLSGPMGFFRLKLR